MQTPAVTSPWCGNIQHAQQVAVQGVQWLFGCLPCVKGHHRVHPTNLESSDADFLIIDSKRKLRVLHIVPHSSSFPSTNKANGFDQVDSGDRCSLESSGEDYWFMRWNRPIRPSLQRNSCNCSFRKSQSKSIPDLNNLKLEEVSEVDAVALERREPIKLGNEKSTEVSLDDLAEKLSHSILIEAVQKSLEIEFDAKDLSNEPPKGFVNEEENTTKYCDSLCVEDIKLTVRESDGEFGGYVNPVFLASNDALHLIPSGRQNDSRDDQSVEKSNLTVDLDTFIKEHQDYNANEQHSLDEINIRNKQAGNNIKQVTASQNDDRVKKRHRKSCLSGSKAHLKKPLLLFIHGAGSNCEIWRNLMHHLQRAGYECVAPDLLGHGYSSAPDNASFYTFHTFLQDLLFLFDRFVVDGRTAVILGHGYGCSMAAAIARYRAEQVIQLVLISGGGPTPLAPRTPPAVSPCLRVCLEPLLMCGFKRDVVYSVCGKQMEPISPETSGVPRHIVEYIAQGHIWPEGDAAFHRRIIAPTLLVHGMKDQHITLVQQCEMERTIPRSFLEVIPEAGHWAMLETPSHLSHMILCFIDWWAPPNRTH